jgi:hypothetical protein
MEKEKIGIEGIILEEKTEEPTEEEKTIWDLVDLEMAVDIAKFIQGQYEDELVYNIPRATEYGGQINWEVLCDKMPDGCSYRKQGRKHIHTLGINILGANKARQLYGKLKIELSKPENVKVEDKNYWLVEGSIVDGHNGNTQNYFYHEPIMIKTSKGGFYFNQYACLSCQTKVTRKLILDVIPGNLKSQWIKDYSEGKAYTKISNIVDAPDDTKSTTSSSEAPKEESAEVTKMIQDMELMTTVEELSNFWNSHAEWYKALTNDDKIEYSGAYKKLMDKLKIPKDSLL